MKKEGRIVLIGKKTKIKVERKYIKEGKEKHKYVKGGKKEGRIYIAKKVIEYRKKIERGGIKWHRVRRGRGRGGRRKERDKEGRKPRTRSQKRREVHNGCRRKKRPRK